MQDPFVGTWKLNVEKSEFSEHHHPASGTIVFEIGADGHYLMRAEGTKANGEAVAERPQRMIPDGKEHPVPGLPGLTAVVSRPDPNTLKAEARREDGSVVGGGMHVVSTDGKSMVATNFGYDSQLREFKQVTVWDRQ